MTASSPPNIHAAASLPALPVHQAFARMALIHPDSPALRRGFQVLSYGALYERASTLARALRRAGVGPGAMVGVGLQRSFDQIAALLAVLQAGAAFVPLDPDWPAQRQEDIAADCCVRLILAEPHAVAGTTARGKGRRAPPTLDLQALLQLSGGAQALDGVAPCDAAAYVLYTSGSTGRPKGVLVEHGALALRLAGMQQVLPLNPQDRVLQRTSLGFDVAIEEIFWPLTIGASVVLAEPAQQLDADYLAGLMAQQRVTVADFVPGLLERVMASHHVDDCHALRYLLCGGEAMPAALMRQALRRLPETQLFNVYGPTEAVINALIWRAGNHGAEAATDRPPIGRPLPHTKALVMDERGCPLPAGRIGELYLGGVLARGYTGAAASTTDPRFVPDPTQPGACLYRSGDLARQRMDGDFEFHGRMDQQVKLHGARIELGEIEAALLAHPQVRQACVLLDGSGSTARLVAYVVSDLPACEPPWRQHLARRLPRYMVPAVFVRLTQMPLTATGKIDRRALPPPPAHALPHPAVPGILGGAVTQLVQALFCRVLRQPGIGLEDDFFEQGGDSLQAAELMAELDELTGMDLDLQTLYDHSSIASLSRHIQANPRTDSHFSLAREFAQPQRAAAAQATPNIVLLRKGEQPGTLFCIHPGDGGSSMYLPLVRLMATRPTVHALTAWDLRRRQWPQSTVQDIAASYVAQVRQAQTQGPYHLLGWSSGAVIAFEMAQQLEQAGQAVGLVGLVDPFEAWETERNDSPLPLPSPDAPFSDDDWQMLLRMFVLDACLPPEGDPFWRMPQAERFESVCSTARALGRFPASLSAQTFRYLCQVVRIHCLAYDRYRPSCGGFDLSLFLPERRDADNINARYWPALTRGRCALFEVGGDHLSMMRIPHVAAVAAAVDRTFAAPAAPLPTG